MSKSSTFVSATEKGCANQKKNHKICHDKISNLYHIKKGLQIKSKVTIYPENTRTSKKKIAIQKKKKGRGRGEEEA